MTLDVTRYGQWLRKVGGGAKMDGKLIGSPARYEYVVVRMAGEVDTGIRHICQQGDDGESWSEKFTLSGVEYPDLAAVLAAYELAMPPEIVETVT